MLNSMTMPAKVTTARSCNLHAQALLSTLYQQGFTLRPLPEGKLEIRPASRLTPELRAELRQRKAEVLLLLEAVTWLRSKLPIPQHIAPLIAEWIGSLDRPTGRSLDMLMQARWTLDVEAYVGEDDRLWWRLPQETVQ